MGWVLFFDGECGVCSTAVRWIAKRDPREHIHFAPLQGKLSGELGLSSCAANRGGTLVLWREPDGPRYFFSDAVIEVVAALGGFWRIIRVARLVPKRLRDWCYRFVADRRHQLSNKGVCPIMEVNIRGRLRE